MKKIFTSSLLVMMAAGLPLTAQAQQEEKEFERFMEEQTAKFDQFVEDNEREFLDFMRKPWSKHEASKPMVKRTKPEPIKPVVYDPSKASKDKEAVCLQIEEILEGSTAESERNKATTKVKDVADITFEKDPVIGKKRKPTTTVIEEKVVVEVPYEGPKVIGAQKEEGKQDKDNNEGGSGKEDMTPGKNPAVRPEGEVDKKPLVVVEEVLEEKKPTVTPVQKEEPLTEGGKQAETKPVTTPTAPVTTPAKPVTIPTTPAVTPTTPAVVPAGRADGTPVLFFDRQYKVSSALKGRCKVRGTTENNLADAYETLYKSNYQDLVKDIRQLSTDLRLNDWGTYTLIKSVSDAFCNDDTSSILMQQFLLNQMGFKARTAREAGSNKLLLFMATNCTIYAHPYYKIGGQTFYCMNGTKPSSFYMCEMDAPSARSTVKMTQDKAPAFSGTTKTSVHQAKNSSARTTIEVPKALMDYYMSFPQCEYNVYSQAAVNPEIEAKLVAQLGPLVEGKSQTEAANILIDFIQSGFDYATDQQQFGFEKPFFVEEVFYYPLCDCEDRSIFYQYIVKKLLGLDVVLLSYPGHLATAVRFTEPVNGDYVMVGNQKYTVCDPTYIGAPIGSTMPQYKTAQVKVLKY